MRTIEELNEVVESNTQTIIDLSNANLEMLKVIRGLAEGQIKMSQINQSIFNDYLSVASELTNVPQSLIVQRVKDNFSQDIPETNLFVVK